MLSCAPSAKRLLFWHGSEYDRFLRGSVTVRRMCQNFAHNFPTMSSRLSIRGATTTSLSVDSSKTQRDEVSKIQQDINIIVQKIAELNGEPAPLGDSDNSSVNSASPFVVGLRSLADTERKFKDVKDLKLTTLEKLLEKISEYDRLLLKETAPVVDPTVVPLRRKSFGQDLHYLPTHLHLTARLMDLHSSSKRVTVIKTTEPGSGGAASGTPPLNPSDKKLIDGLKATVAKQTKQLEDAEARSSHSQEENQQLKRTNEELKTQVQALQIKPAAAAAPTVVVDPKSAQQQEENQQLKRTNEELKAQLLSLLSKPAPPIMPSNDSEVAALKARVLELERHTDTLQQRLEVEVGNYQGMVSVALGKASRINNHVDLDGKGDDCVNLPADARNAYNALEKAISGRLDGLKAELRLITSIKELLDGELSTSTLQRDILQRDLCTVQEQHEALKAAYDALSYETARQASQSSSSTADLEAQQDLLRSANETNKALLGELQEAQSNLKQLEKWPMMLAALEERLNAAVQDKTRAEAVSVSAKDEVTHYKKLTETLKQKLRDLGGGTADNKEFLDTFEEVMKEEMMTMKAAFETKLRLAREEADATSKRHQQEIVRMQSTSPYVALNRAAGLVGSAGNLAGKK